MTTQKKNNLPFTKDDYYTMLNQMVQSPLQPGQNPANSVVNRLRNAAMKGKPMMAGTTL